MRISKSTIFPAAIILLILGGIGINTLNSTKKIPPPPRPEIPEEQQEDLSDDLESVNTVVYGVRGSKGSLVGAINDSGKNNSPVTFLDSDSKFAYPLKNGKQIIYIAETDSKDLSKKIVIKNIVPDGALEDGAEIVVYEVSGDYKIDKYIISENNEWIAWIETRPEFGDVPTHSSDYFKSYKANIVDITDNGSREKISAIQLSDEKAEPGRLINFPSLITDDGRVYFDALPPDTYALYSGFRNEQLNTILAADTYNSKPYLFNQRYILYSAFNPDNATFPDDGDTDSTRPSVLNTNIVKVFDLETNSEIVVAPGDEGELYMHPVYVSGEPGSDLTIAAEIYTIGDAVGGKAFVAKELQLITSSNGTFEKRTIAGVSDTERQKILGVGTLPNGNKTLLVADDTGELGNFGTGNGIYASGYTTTANEISVYDLTELKKIKTLTSLTDSKFEFLGLMPKRLDEKIGIERNPKIDREAIERTKKQLQLGTFVPVEPKRQRTNPRSECVTEWEKKNYPNYEACEACPIYIYSDEGTKDVTIQPITSISEASSNMPLVNGAWKFQANEDGKLFANGNTYKNIDFYFPRSSYQAPTEGWVIQKSGQDKRISEIAHGLGFNEREIQDIISHFAENITSEVFLLGVLSDSEAKKLLDFKVSPNPDFVKTVMFYVKDLESNVSYGFEEPQDIYFDRKDFAVVTWGVVSE